MRSADQGATKRECTRVFRTVALNVWPSNVQVQPRSGQHISLIERICLAASSAATPVGLHGATNRERPAELTCGRPRARTAARMGRRFGQAIRGGRGSGGSPLSTVGPAHAATGVSLAAHLGGRTDTAAQPKLPIPRIMSVF